MSITEILHLDCREPENMAILRKALTKTSWLERFADEPEDITIEVLEKLYQKVKAKYPGMIGYIQASTNTSWHAMLKRSDDHLWIETVFFQTFFEGMAKAILVLYAHFLKGVNFKYKPTKSEEKQCD